MDNRVVRLAGLLFLALGTLAGCASAPTSTAGDAASAPSPVDESRSEISAAQAAGYAVDDALPFQRQAEQAAAAGDREAAARAAEQARRAVEARKAIDGARPEVEKAMREAGPLASDAGKLLEAAEAALKAGDPVRAAELASQARRQAADAVEQKKSESARAAQAARDAANRYRVARGETLWSISGRSTVYGNPLLWPLLFKSNQDRIDDPDLIRAGQRLSVWRDPSEAERQEAKLHARTRGPWTLGAREASDSAYLAR